jgi:D-glycero-D-manno-heptose 1,7-bisphosphate phosphatase
VSPRFRHVILDRDGVLNREAADGTPITVETWQWEDGALAALRRLTQAGVRLSVATNQACIGRGILSRAQVDAVHARMQREAALAGVTIAGVYLCPHPPDERCACRKPLPGLLTEAIAASETSGAHTLFVGDAARDLEAGRAAGIPVALVRTGKGASTEKELAARGVPVFDSLSDLAEDLLRAG